MREALQHAWLQAMVDQMPEPVIVLDDDGQRRAAEPAGAGARARDRTSRRLPASRCCTTFAIRPASRCRPTRCRTTARCARGRACSARSSWSRRPSAPSPSSPARRRSASTRTWPAPSRSSRTSARSRSSNASAKNGSRSSRTTCASRSARSRFRPRCSRSASRSGAAGARARERRAHSQVGGQAPRMINDLLDASRLEAHRLTIERAPVNLRALLEEITSTLPELAGNAVHMSFPRATPWVSADSGRLEQIFRNLLSNAAKYGTARHADRGRGRIAPRCVRDHGLQSGRRHRERGHGAHVSALRPFRSRPSARAFPASASACTSRKGLVEAHGGRIWVESTPGQTTTFHVVLPALVQHAQAG